MEIEYTNDSLWNHLSSKFQQAQAVYIDCWYDIHSIKAADNEAQKQALRIIRNHFAGKTLFITQHVGRESNESLQRKRPLGIRELGPFRWAQRVAQGFVLLRKAETIIVQEKIQQTDEDGAISGERLDFQVWSRSTPECPLLTFEPDYGDDTREFKYRRKMVTNLSTLAASILNRIQGKGPWASTYVLLKEIGKGGKQKKALDELLFKGFITEATDGSISVNEVNKTVFIEAAKNPVASKQADDFLKKMFRAGQAVEKDSLFFFAKSEGIILGSPGMYRGVTEYLNTTDGKWYWRMVDQQAA